MFGSFKTHTQGQGSHVSQSHFWSLKKAEKGAEILKERRDPTSPGALCLALFESAMSPQRRCTTLSYAKLRYRGWLIESRAASEQKAAILTVS